MPADLISRPPWTSVPPPPLLLPLASGPGRHLCPLSTGVLQAPVFIYTHSLSRLFQTHGFRFHLYADGSRTDVSPDLYAQVPTCHVLSSSGCAGGVSDLARPHPRPDLLLEPSQLSLQPPIPIAAHPPSQLRGSCLTPQIARSPHGVHQDLCHCSLHSRRCWALLPMPRVPLDHCTEPGYPLATPHSPLPSAQHTGLSRAHLLPAVAPRPSA